MRLRPSANAAGGQPWTSGQRVSPALRQGIQSFRGEAATERIERLSGRMLRMVEGLPRSPGHRVSPRQQLQSPAWLQAERNFEDRSTRCKTFLQGLLEGDKRFRSEIAFQHAVSQRVELQQFGMALAPLDIVGQGHRDLRGPCAMFGPECPIELADHLTPAILQDAGRRSRPRSESRGGRCPWPGRRRRRWLRPREARRPATNNSPATCRIASRRASLASRSQARLAMHGRGGSGHAVGCPRGQMPRHHAAAEGHHLVHATGNDA